ncbi:hypothetical protein BC830DRAFT_1123407 [Chytriomyces sp. MP71]|nr:hypothetical protein BC830DRAFT_1123407 [Chytriomyces sp. MP71]
MNLSNDWRSVTAPEIATFGNESARAHAWSARGWIGALLRHTLNNVTLALDGTVFVHGGITVEWARLGVDEINARARKALLREEWGNAVFERPRGPLWYRGYALEEEEEVCTELKAALALLSAKRMVIGHTPQLATGEILSRCDGRVFVIDVGITTRYGGNCAALEIVEDTVTALYCIDDKPEEARRVDMTPRQGHGEL